MKITHPNQTTYFICYNQNKIDVKSYGVIESHQEMETSQPIVEQYLDIEEWKGVLLTYGIDVED